LKYLFFLQMFLNMSAAFTQSRFCRSQQAESWCCIHGQKLKSRCCPRWEIASQEDAPNNARESFTEFVHREWNGSFLRMKKNDFEKK